MTEIHHNDRNSNFEKTYPGCMGRMVSLLELNTWVSANRLLNDKPHQNGSPLQRNISDVSRMSSSNAPAEERVFIPEFKNSFPNRKPNGTPMKMLIAQEMSKEVDSRWDPPNLVAKLMGLDALPQQRSQKSPHLARYEETAIDRKMAFVRQKFVEAKRLSMNEKLSQSKQFQDALEVLNSNKDLFLKCLQEPDSLFSENLYSQQSATHHEETKRIIVLRPSKVAGSNDSAEAGKKDGKLKKKGAFLEMSGLENVHPEIYAPASLEHYENPTQPTQIVVLKPSPGGKHGAKTVGSPYSELRRVLGREIFFGDVEDDENQESREVAQTIRQQMCKKLGRHRRDETLISSVLSNGYVGDESSFGKSEFEYVDGDLSDSKAILSVSGHSWDYVNRLSPYSSSSFTRTFFSPESSVSQEAKKRISERWAMMASTEIYQEKRNSQRSSSSTLGEMLALSETKAASSYGEEGSSSQEPKNSDILLVSEQSKGENMKHIPGNLMRSKSVPVSSTEFETRLNIGISVSGKGKSESLKGDTKERSAKSLLKVKVSNLLFSRYKKPTEDKSPDSDTIDEFYLFPEEICFERTESLSDKGSVHASTPLEPSRKASSSNLTCEHGMISPENGLLVEQPITFGNAGENLNQPSPISVLDPLSEEDDHVAKVYPHYFKPVQQGYESQSGQRATPVKGANNFVLECTSSTMLDDVWTQMNGWFSGAVRGVSDDCGRDDSLMVEGVIRKEVVGEGWSNQFRLQMDNLGQEFEGKLLEELVLEVVVELTGKV